MALDLKRERGVPVERQEFDWLDLARIPISKLDDDAFTRCRIIFLNGMEEESIRFKHFFQRMYRDLQVPLARQRRAEHFQQLLVQNLLPPDQSVLETTIGYEQQAIEVTADLALKEPDPYLAQSYRFTLLEDFDHLYRFCAALDRVEGKDPNNLLQSYTDILPGRPSRMEHRAPEDDVRRPYDRATASPITKLNALVLLAGETQVNNYYKQVFPLVSDPVSRALLQEIATIEEQHVTQYSSLVDPAETWFEKWLLHEAMEVYAYHSCAAQETNPRVRAIWERFVDYELGHLHEAVRWFEQAEGRDAWEVLPATLPEPIGWTSHRDFIRETLRRELTLTSVLTEYVDHSRVPPDAASLPYRLRLNQAGVPSDIAAAGYSWSPGTEQFRARPPTDDGGPPENRVTAPLPGLEVPGMEGGLH